MRIQILKYFLASANIPYCDGSILAATYNLLVIKQVYKA